MTNHTSVDPLHLDRCVSRPIWQIGRRVAVIAACIGFSTVAACGFGFGDTDTVDESSDIEIGECLTIGDADGGKVAAGKADCTGTDGLTFYAAAKVPENSDCDGDNTATLTFADGDEKLCMTPNFEAGSCYQIPVSGGDLADYRKVDCAAHAASSTIIAESVTRADDSVTCTEDQVKWQFTSPESIGYCLRPVTV